MAWLTEGAGRLRRPGNGANIAEGTQQLTRGRTIHRLLRENVAMIVIAHVFAFTSPAIVHAAWDYQTVNFTQPIRVARGEISPTGPNAMYLSDDEGCRLAKTEWGWAECTGLERIVIGGAPMIDTVLYSEPVSEGYVSLDDFFASGAQEEIEAMGAELKESHAQQAKRTGKNIEYLGWRLFPKADKAQNVIYYAYNSAWDNQPQINVKATLLDRYGYVVIDIVPQSAELTEAEIKQVVDEAIGSYKPDPVASYSAFEKGDKIAAYGGLGVLATVLGVKYGKAATAGLLALLAIFLKKGGFLIVIPFVWLFRKAGGLLRRGS
jgi:uncharacterized membrane-anchored protein